jgi:hypothetical protein
VLVLGSYGFSSPETRQKLDKIITEDNKANYMANMLHPNRAGMDEISKEVVKVLENKYKGE